MPTGYTAAVADGEQTELRDFALTCARAMGALIMMRDEPSDAPIPQRFEPSPFYANELAKVTEELRVLRAMSASERTKAADAEYSEKIDGAVKWHDEKEAVRARYNAMIEKVEAWQGAPDGLKDFMLEQLHRGRDFDAPANAEYYDKAVRKTGAEWFNEREKELSDRRARYAAEAEKERDRTEGRNAWLDQLRQSLEFPA